MKHKKKNMLRIGTLITILMFLLVPLLSSNVAASHSVLLGSAFTDNTPNGPTGSVTVGGVPANIRDPSAPRDANYWVDYDFNDNNGGGNGSDHWIQVNVSWCVPPTYIPAFMTFTQTPPIFIGAGLGSTTGTYTTPWLFAYGPVGTTFNVTFGVYCRDRQTWTTRSWFSSIISYKTIP